MSIDVVSTAQRPATVAEPAQFANTSTSSMKVRVVAPVAARLRFSGPFETIDLVDSDYPLIANVPEVFHLDAGRALHVGSLTDDVSIDFAVINIHGSGSSVTVIGSAEGGGSSEPVEWNAIEGKPDGIDDVVDDVVVAKNRADEAYLLASQGVSKFTTTAIPDIDLGEASISEHTIVTTSSDGKRYEYVAGPKNETASYTLLSDLTPEWAAIEGKPAGLDGVVERVDGLVTVYDLGTNPISEFTTITGGTPYSAGFKVRAAAPGFEYNGPRAWYQYQGGDANDAASYVILQDDVVRWTSPSVGPTGAQPRLVGVPDAVKAMPANDSRRTVPFVAYNINADMSAYRECVLRFSVSGYVGFGAEEVVAYVDINLNSIPLPFSFTGELLAYALNDAVRQGTFEAYIPGGSAEVDRFVAAAVDFPLFEWNELTQQLRFWAPVSVVETSAGDFSPSLASIELISGADIITDCWNFVTQSSEPRRFPLATDGVMSVPATGSTRARSLTRHLKDIEGDVTALGANRATLVIPDLITGFISIPGADAPTAAANTLVGLGFSDGDTVDLYSNVGSFDESASPVASFAVSSGSTVGDLIDYAWPGVTLYLVQSMFGGWNVAMVQQMADVAAGKVHLLAWNQNVYTGVPQIGFSGLGGDQPLVGELIETLVDDEHVKSNVFIPLPFVPVGAPADKGNMRSAIERLMSMVYDGATARLGTLKKGPFTATQQVQSSGVRSNATNLIAELAIADGETFTIPSVLYGDATLIVGATTSVEDFVTFVNDSAGAFSPEPRMHARVSTNLQRLIVAWQTGGDGDIPITASSDGLLKMFS